MISTDISLKPPKDAALQLLDYCRKNDWAGHDPYDALNSRLFKLLPLIDFRLFRLGFTQVLKRFPVNIRPILLIPKMQNPKAIAVFLTALLKLSKHGLLDAESLIQQMQERLSALRSPNTPYWCWGYSFPWQTRLPLVPIWAPNLVSTVFVADALLDAFDSHGDPRCYDIAYSAAEYLLNELYWEDETAACFCYPTPSSQTRVHNANFLGAALLCRVYRHSGEDRFLEPALKAARYSAAKQHEDGSWYYGEHATQRWIDNFHTGYNLCALRAIGKYADTSEFEPHIRRGFEFYREHFFREDGAPRYFHDRTYPIDIHCVAQSIITLQAFRDLDEKSSRLAHTVFEWAIKHMWDEKGYFYYQSLPSFKVKISYMRWSQAWMLLALSTLLDEQGKSATGAETSDLPISQSLVSA